MLYRPWRVEEKGKQLQIVFRDHAMSDQIGFHYQRMPADHAVDDFIGKLEAIGHATTANAGHRPTLVSIILDGENCWEYYPNGGVDFLRQLYRRVVAASEDQAGAHGRLSGPAIRPPTRSATSSPGVGSSTTSASGSAIPSAIAPGTCCSPDAQSSARPPIAEQQKTAEQLDGAWRELYIAEGSDWFWWFGDSHSSAQDALFDRLFRKHLQNVYTLLDDEPPDELSQPISQGTASARLHTEPTGLLNVKVDGRRTYFEWINAGHYVRRGDRGTMSMVTTASRIESLHFGFDAEQLLLRLDARGGPVREQWVDLEALRITFLEPEGFELLVVRPASREPTAQLFQRNVPVSGQYVRAAADVILELAIPWRSLAVGQDDPVHWIVELIRDEDAIERAPAEGAIETLVPSADFELVLWQV